jgi:hypothetical protein
MDLHFLPYIISSFQLKVLVNFIYVFLELLLFLVVLLEAFFEKASSYVVGKARIT